MSPGVCFLLFTFSCCNQIVITLSLWLSGTLMNTPPSHRPDVSPFLTTVSFVNAASPFPQCQSLSQLLSSCRPCNFPCFVFHRPSFISTLHPVFFLFSFFVNHPYFSNVQSVNVVVVNIFYASSLVVASGLPKGWQVLVLEVHSYV